MSKLSVETGQNVIIHQDVANVGERIAAYLIDYIIIVSYVIVMMLISENLIHYRNQGIYMFVVFIPVFFYSLLSEIFLDGQSIGKKALKTKVVKIDGSQASIGSYAIRWMFRLVDINLFSGLVAIITISINGKGQRVGDIVAKTTVISLKRNKRIDDTIYVDIPDEYVPVYSDVDMLEDSDIKTIKDVVKHYKKNVSNTIAVTMIKKTVDAVKKKTGIESNETPLAFLETILKDYNHIHKNNINK